MVKYAPIGGVLPFGAPLPPGFTGKYASPVWCQELVAGVRG